MAVPKAQPQRRVASFEDSVAPEPPSCNRCRASDEDSRFRPAWPVAAVEIVERIDASPAPAALASVRAARLPLTAAYCRLLAAYLPLRPSTN